MSFLNIVFGLKINCNYPNFEIILKWGTKEVWAVSPTRTIRTNLRRNLSHHLQELAERRKIKEFRQPLSFLQVHLHLFSHTYYQVSAQAAKARKDKGLSPHGGIIRWVLPEGSTPEKEWRRKRRVQKNWTAQRTPHECGHPWVVRWWEPRHCFIKHGSWILRTYTVFCGQGSIGAQQLHPYEPQEYGSCGYSSRWCRPSPQCDESLKGSSWRLRRYWWSWNSNSRDQGSCLTPINSSWNLWRYGYQTSKRCHPLRRARYRKNSPCQGSGQRDISHFLESGGLWTYPKVLGWWPQIG